MYGESSRQFIVRIDCTSARSEEDQLQKEGTHQLNLHVPDVVREHGENNAEGDRHEVLWQADESDLCWGRRKHIASLVAAALLKASILYVTCDLTASRSHFNVLTAVANIADSESRTHIRQFSAEYCV
jgi:hypothetical protein